MLEAAVSLHRSAMGDPLHLPHLETLVSNIRQKVEGETDDALERFTPFLTLPTTLARPSLIVRCKAVDGVPRLTVVTNKAVSASRLRGAFIPFLHRVLRPTDRADFLVLISDRVYPSPEAAAEFADFLQRVPLLRCDWSEDDPFSRAALIIHVGFARAVLEEET